MLKNSRIASFAAVGVVAALAVGSLVVASNMGFKGRFIFPGSVGTWFSPPYHSPYQTADDLLAATCPTAGGRIQRTITTLPPGFQFWLGAAGGGGNGLPGNFALNAGEGYEVKPNLASPGFEDVVLVGSHDPFTSIPLSQRGLPGSTAAAGGGSSLGDEVTTPDGFVANHDYLISVPWHTTYLTAEDLRVDLPGAARVVRKVETAGAAPAFFFWNGAAGNPLPGDPQNFALTLGEAYEVRILLDTPQGVTPAHF